MLGIAQNITDTWGTNFLYREVHTSKSANYWPQVS